MKISVGCAQISPEKGKIETNIDRIAELIQQSYEEKMDLLLFPEACITGYYLEGGVIEKALTTEELSKKLEKRLSFGPQKKIDFVLGFYRKEDGILYNSAAYYEFGPEGLQLIHVYSKFFLPTYGIFDEKRYVARGNDLGVFDTRFGRIAILICEDVWHSIFPALCALKGATLFLIPSASPARGFSSERPSNLEKYERLLQSLSEEHGVHCVNAMLCGFEGGKGLVGGSMVIDPFGNIVVKGPVQEEYLLKADIDQDQLVLARAQSPLLSDLKSVWSDIEKIINRL